MVLMGPEVEMEEPAVREEEGLAVPSSYSVLLLLQALLLSTHRGERC